MHARHIVTRDDRDYAGRALRKPCIDAGDPALRRRAHHRHTVGEARGGMIGRVFGRSCPFEPAVYAIYGLSDCGAHAFPPVFSATRRITPPLSNSLSTPLSPLC